MTALPPILPAGTQVVERTRGALQPRPAAGGPIDDDHVEPAREPVDRLDVPPQIALEHQRDDSVDFDEFMKEVAAE